MADEGMKKCKSCMEEIPAGAKKCKHCGTDQRNWFRRHYIITGFLGLIVLGSIMSAAGGSKNSSKTTTQTAGTASADEKTYTDISCPDFTEKFGLKSSLSNLQKDDAFAKDYAGKYVKWSGTVSSIDNGLLGGYTLQIKCNPATFVSDVLINLDNSQKDALMAYKKGDKINFSGSLKSWGQLMVTIIDDGSITK